jgi:hypothetical protein
MRNREHQVVAARLLSRNPATTYKLGMERPFFLLGKIHLSHQVLEARVRTQVIETGIDLQ